MKIKFYKIRITANVDKIVLYNALNRHLSGYQQRGKVINIHILTLVATNIIYLEKFSISIY